MKLLLPTLLFFAFARPMFGQGSPAQAAPNQPYTVEYDCKVQWGHRQEFLQLFLKNHYTLLKKVIDSGRMLSVKIETPANHMTEESRWDYHVTIRLKNPTLATTENPDESKMIKQLGLMRRNMRAKSSAGSRFSEPLGSSGDRYYMTVARIKQR